MCEFWTPFGSDVEVWLCAQNADCAESEVGRDCIEPEVGCVLRMLTALNLR